MMILGFILVGLIGLAVGFWGGRFYSDKSLKTAQLQKQLDDSQQQMDKYREDVSANLGVTQQLIIDMKSSYDNIVEHMEHTTRLLQQPNRITDPNLQYFGYDATKSILDPDNSKPDTKRKNEQIDAQPSDYSDGASGLFDNSGTQKNRENEKE